MRDLHAWHLRLIRQARIEKEEKTLTHDFHSRKSFPEENKMRSQRLAYLRKQQAANKDNRILTTEQFLKTLHTGEL